MMSVIRVRVRNVRKSRQQHFGALLIPVRVRDLLLPPPPNQFCCVCIPVPEHNVRVNMMHLCICSLCLT